MEQMKPLDEVFKPDSRMDGWGTLESDHEELCEVRLSEAVPGDIKGYFETVKNICLYGRFVYAFYGVACSLSFFLLEMALRKRFAVNPKKSNAKHEEG
jgi:hypothetical protein